jgi:hypothetical protein
MSNGTQFILILGLMAGLTYVIAMAAWYKPVKPNALEVPPRTPTEFKEIVSGLTGKPLFAGYDLVKQLL